MEPVVAQDVERRYGDTVALAGVSLTVEPGEVFGLIGPNGAGKTTLVRALTGTTTPDGGSVRLFGTPPPAVDSDRLGVLPQNFSPPDRLTARELLRYYAGLYDKARDPEAVLDAVGLADAADTRYENLSGGQQRRVCVGSALVNDPDVLVLDEPTTGIDPAGRRTVWGLIDDLTADGTTVVLTTHDMAEAERLADRVGVLVDGSLVSCGRPDTLVEKYGGSSHLTVDVDTESESVLRTDSATSSLATETTTAESTSEFAIDPFTGEPIDESGSIDIDGYTAEIRNGALVFEDIGPTEIGAVVDVLHDYDVAYTELSWAEPDLEDVYLALAGEVTVAGHGPSRRAGDALDSVSTNQERGARSRSESGQRTQTGTRPEDRS